MAGDNGSGRAAEAAALSGTEGQPRRSSTVKDIATLLLLCCAAWQAATAQAVVQLAENTESTFSEAVDNMLNPPADVDSRVQIVPFLTFHVMQLSGAGALLLLWSTLRRVAPHVVISPFTATPGRPPPTSLEMVWRRAMAITNWGQQQTHVKQR